jgi:hypothetical protein
MQADRCASRFGRRVLRASVAFLSKVVVMRTPLAAADAERSAATLQINALQKREENPVPFNLSGLKE